MTRATLLLLALLAGCAQVTCENGKITVENPSEIVPEKLRIILEACNWPQAQREIK